MLNNWSFKYRCKLPDQSAKDSFKCACGDTSFGIPPEKQSLTWQNQAFWCSTTMTMMNFDGTTKYVWNPFSLAELQQLLGGGKLDAYLQCVAGGGQCTAPSHDIFKLQQVMRCGA